MNRRLRKRLQPWADLTLAVALAGVGLLAATGSTPISLGGTASLVGPRAVVGVSYVVAAATLILRRRRPFAVFLVVVVALGVTFAVFGSSEGFSSIVPVFVALYSVGAHAKVGRAVAALAVYAGFWMLFELRDPLNPDVHAALGSWPLFLVGVILLLFGAFLRTRRLYIGELRMRAELAESDREERVRAARIDERSRIARELHDAVAHAMTVMVMQAEAADEMLDLDLSRARQAVQQVQHVGRGGLAEMRRLLGVLRHDFAPAFAPQPGLAATPALVADVSATGLAVTLTIDGEPRAVSAGVDISAYRIIQEALTNVIKHARASSVAVRVSYSDILALEVIDDGLGVAGRGDRGHGLIGMQERVALYGGTLRIGAVAGGFGVRATLPIEPSA